MNIISFDVEEWFQVGTFLNSIEFSHWDRYPPRVNLGLEIILKLLRDAGIKATFFVVGKLAERDPSIIHKILADDHSIGLHSYSHKPVVNQSKSEFRDDLERGIGVLSELASRNIELYRLPNYQITKNTLWVLDTLVECGIKIDSSIYPISTHPSYGLPDAPTEPFKLKNGLYEFPMSTFNLGKMVLPYCSGAYFRFVPYIVTETILSRQNSNGFGRVMNFHPWEFDSAHTDLIENDVPNISSLQKIRHTLNVKRNTPKLRRLLSDFQFTTFEDYIKDKYIPEHNLDMNNMPATSSV